MTKEPDARRAMRESRERWDTIRLTIAEIANYRRMSASDLGNAMGMSRSTVSSRLAGTSTIRPEEVDGFAVVLGVERTLLDLEPEAALRELLGKAPRTGSRCKVSADSQAIAA